MERGRSRLAGDLESPPDRSGSPREAVRLAERALIVRLAADGQTNREIGLRLGITEEKAARWRGRLIAQGRAGLEQDAPGRGRQPA